MTAPTSDHSRVAAALAGDLAAFEALIRHHEGGARATARAATGDPEAARDVLQDAFLDAHRLLHQLREPAAFGAWLRRIVHKHADRWRRRQRELALTEPDRQLDPAAGPARVLDRQRLADRVRTALMTLPPDQGEAAAHFYLAGRTAAEIAADLGVPLTTIKKRLHSARQRLRKEFEMDGALRREFSRSDLATEVRFFLSVRAGRVDEVSQLLDDEPELVHAHENWSREEALRDALPYADHATALARAAAQGDADMLELLLARGAEIDTACDCAASETALFNAVGAGEAELVTRLLEAGADPDRAAGPGTTPLHLAAHAGHAECAEILLQHGARLDTRDLGGRTAEDWARELGNEALANRLEARRGPLETPGAARSASELRGRVLAPDGSSLDGGPEVARRPSLGRGRPELGRGTQLMTGVKVIDAFCPLPRAGKVAIRGAGGHGILVTLGELTERIARASGSVVWCAFEERGDEGQALRAGLKELGVDRCSTLVLAERRHGADQHDRALHTAFEIADGTSSEDAATAVILLADETREEVIERALRNCPESVLLIVAWVRVLDPGRDPAPFAERWDAHLLFDPDLATKQLWPAIDPVRSVTCLLREGGVDQRHLEIVNRSRAVLAREDPRADRLREYLTQPFHTTTAFTAIPGADVAYEALLGDLEVLLDENPTGPDDRSLRMTGSLSRG
jgi:RNA polymerase sigma-70 factor (ECF subfamily)